MLGIALVGRSNLFEACLLAPPSWLLSTYSVSKSLPFTLKLLIRQPDGIMVIRTSGKHALNEILNVTEDNTIPFRAIWLPWSQWFDLYALKYWIRDLRSITLAGIEDCTTEWVVSEVIMKRSKRERNELQ